MPAGNASGWLPHLALTWPLRCGGASRASKSTGFFLGGARVVRLDLPHKWAEDHKALFVLLDDETGTARSSSGPG
jgi:hypothetical protein